MKMMAERDKTQAQLASKVGKSRQTIGKYVTGDAQPDAETLKGIAEYLGVSADYLLVLTDVQTTDIENRAIADKTGLSVSAIDALEEIKDKSYGKTNAFVLSELLKMGFIERLVDNLRECIQHTGTVNFVEREVYEVNNAERARNINGYIEWSFFNLITKLYNEAMLHFENSVDPEQRKKLLEEKWDSYDSDVRNGLYSLVESSGEGFSKKNSSEKNLAVLRKMLNIEQ
jgi:transcriptional regulator with XRE-family HTH domain